MMPATFVEQPKDSTLRRCVRTYRRKVIKHAWKTFRGDPVCGPCAVRCLQDAYGPRCMYCDHAHGWTVDHVAPKAKEPARRFAWANWRPACMDCNNKKGTKRIVDPLRADPRAYLVFDLVTGAPAAIATGRAKPIAEATREVLDNQTLNEARRVIRARAVEDLRALANGRHTAKRRILALLAPTTPHRAVLRELILESDPALNPYRSTVDAALKVMPELEAWARAPCGSPP